MPTARPEGHAAVTPGEPMFPPPAKYRDREQIEPGLRRILRELLEGDRPWPLFLQGTQGSGKTCAVLCMIDWAGGWYIQLPDLCTMCISAGKGELTWSSGARRTTNEIWDGWRRGRDDVFVSAPARSARALVGWAITMLVVGVAWIFFRAPDFPSAFAVLEGILQMRGGFDTRLLVLPAQVILLLFFIDIPQHRKADQEAILGWNWLVRGITYASFVMLLVLFGDLNNVPFIYFQF